MQQVQETRGSSRNLEHPLSARQVAATGKAGSRRTLFGICVGTALESFDFSAYALFAPFFAANIFNPADPAAALLATFAVFSAGFLIRPFGALAVGWLADRKGRKFSFIAALLCSSMGILLVGIAPSYERAGVLGAGILLTARLLSGLAQSCQFSIAKTYVSEIAPAKHRGIWSSSLFVASLSSAVLANLLMVVLTMLLSDADMKAWGWRVPFIVGAVLGLVVVGFRGNMDETVAFVIHAHLRESDATKPSLMRALWIHRAAGVRVFFLTGSYGVLFYAWAISGTSWAISILKIKPNEALWAGVIAQVICIAALPVMGALSDRIGRRGSFFIFGISVAALSFPLDHLARGGDAWHFGLALTVALLLVAIVASMFPALLAEMFPTGLRVSGIALPSSLASIVFAGTTPFLQHWLSQRGSGDIFVAYTAAVALLGAIVMYFTPETKGIDITDPDAAANAEK